MKDEKLSGTVIIRNRGILELGKITKTYKRKKIRYYDVMTERGILLEHLTIDSSFPCYIQPDFKRLVDTLSPTTPNE